MIRRGGVAVDADLIAEMLRVTGAFFDLPPEEKMRYSLDDRSANRGYAPEGSEALAYSLGERDLPTDLFEAFNVGCELSADQLADPYYRGRGAQFFAPNVWPAMPSDFRDVWLAYFDAVDAVANEVMAAAAVALGMPADPVPGLQISDGRSHDAVIECLPTCCDAADPPRYAPVSSGDHLLAKLMGPRLLRPSEPSPRT